MRVAYFDCFAGVAGDMILGALIDAGLAPGDLESDLAGLRVSGYRIRWSKTERNGIAGTEFIVETDEEGVDRTAGEILALVESSDLVPEVKSVSTKILRELAAAEAEIHGLPLEEVRLHELGGLDTIVDVVGAVSGLRRLSVAAVYASPIHVGTGFVECRHGTLPVPSPATMALLDGVPVRSSGIESELATPTGVAILRVVAKTFGPMPSMRVRATGYGAGTRSLPIPNLLRVSIGEVGGTYDADEIAVVETNLDDMSPELIAYAVESLLAKGALDAFVAPVFMKKNRPGSVLTVLAPPDRLDEVVETIFAETTTLGVRVSRVGRRLLLRSTLTVPTRFGPLAAKVGEVGDGPVKISPEYEVCRKAAIAHGVPLKDVYEAVVAAARRALADGSEGGDDLSEV